jgi:hypothetical protein
MKRLVAILLLTLACATSRMGVGEGEVARGQEVFATYCTDGCHQTPRPDSLTAGQWRAVVHTMQARLEEQGLAPMAPEEYDALLAYLSAHARR